MQITKTQLVVGRPAIQVRDALRKLVGKEISVESVALAFGVDLTEADKLFHDLVSAKYIGCEVRRKLPGQMLVELFAKGGQPTDDMLAKHGVDEIRYCVDYEGMRLIGTRFVKRITRRQAESLIEAFLVRVGQVNGRDELTHRVTEVRVFGSYLTHAETLGDIDLAVSLEGKQAEAETAGMDWIQVCLSRAAESGRRFKTYGDQLCYSEIEVKRFLKARSPYLSFHALDELARLGCRSEVLFKM
jgi:hypothetical protein